MAAARVELRSHDDDDGGKNEESLAENDGVTIDRTDTAAVARRRRCCWKDDFDMISSVDFILILAVVVDAIIVYAANVF